MWYNISIMKSVKKTIRKVAKKIAPKTVAKVEKKEAMAEIKKSKYIIELKLNGVTYVEHTDNIEEALMALKPDQVLIEMYVKVHNDKFSNERRLSLVQARKIFTDPIAREVFINNFLLD